MAAMIAVTAAVALLVYEFLGVNTSAAPGSTRPALAYTLAVGAAVTLLIA